MEEIIRKECIQLHQLADGYEQAITIAGKPLVDCGSIEEAYLTNMINSVKELGPYMVLMPGFALAHAAPSEVVKKDDLSIAIFDNDIVFGCDNDPVRVIMCLACTDGESHVVKLQVIALKLMDDEMDLIARLTNASSIDEVYQLVNS